VVILQVTSPTYPGKEVTGSVTNGCKIFGVVSDQNTYSGNDMISGKWVNVQTYGYVPNIRVTTAGGGVGQTVTAGDGIFTSATSMVGRSGGAGVVTGTVISLQTTTAASANATCKGFIGGV
jgi:hypothetical protein